MDANDLRRHDEKNVSLHGTSPWDPDQSAAYINYISNTKWRRLKDHNSSNLVNLRNVKQTGGEPNE